MHQPGKILRMSRLDPVHPVAIVGAGPIGIELGAAFRVGGVQPLHIEARQVGHTLTWWPRNTEFFSTTERLAIAGVPIPSEHQGRITGEAYLAYLRAVVEQFDLRIRTYEPVIDLRRDNGFYRLTTDRHGVQRAYAAEKVVLAVGDMASPQRLEIPGEDLPHVSHYFRDPHDYFKTRLLIVGGKNSAVEAALRCWRAGADVTLSYRGESLDRKRVKPHLLPDLETQIEKGNIRFLPGTRPLNFQPGIARLVEETARGTPSVSLEVPTDFVLLCTGFVADTRLFKLAGVSLSGPNQVPAFDHETMETDVPGVYVAGTAAAGTQSRYTLFIENTHVHVGRIVRHITGSWPQALGMTDAVPLSAVEAN
jgi:thioredoxin reductase (NADPH)